MFYFSVYISSWTLTTECAKMASKRWFNFEWDELCFLPHLPSQVCHWPATRYSLWPIFHIQQVKSSQRTAWETSQVVWQWSHTSPKIAFPFLFSSCHGRRQSCHLVAELGGQSRWRYPSQQTLSARKERRINRIFSPISDIDTGGSLYVYLHYVQLHSHCDFHLPTSCTTTISEAICCWNWILAAQQQLQRAIACFAIAIATQILTRWEFHSPANCQLP